MAFLYEGPYTDKALNRLANTNDPTVAEWMQRSRDYVKRAADNGEVEAIANMSNYYQFTEINHQEALRFFSAQMEISRRNNKPVDNVSSQRIVAMLSKNISKEAAVKAIESGRKLAVSAATKRD